jgi:bacterioferritin-associated ferredoxin
MEEPSRVYICICNAITDSQIRNCARAGACTLSDLQMQLGVACQCGTCADAACALLREERVQARAEDLAPMLGWAAPA